MYDLSLFYFPPVQVDASMVARRVEGQRRQREEWIARRVSTTELF